MVWIEPYCLAVKRRYGYAGSVDWGILEIGSCVRRSVLTLVSFG